MNALKWVLACLVLILLTAPSLAQDYRIDSWNETIAVKRDSTFSVSETLKVTFLHPVPGIERDLRYIRENESGNQHEIFIRHIEVNDPSGHPYLTDVHWEDNRIIVRVGDPAILVPPGGQRIYVITYTVANAITWSNRSDWTPAANLFWNLTGEDSNVDIESLRARVTFPNLDGHSPHAKLVVSKDGSVDTTNFFEYAQGITYQQNNTTVLLSSTELDIDRTAPIRAGDWLAIDMSLAQTAIPPFGIAKRIGYWLWPNLGILTPIVLLLGLFFAWLLFGRDPPRKPIAIQFEPPDGLSAATAGVLIDERIDKRDISAGIVSLAVKGYLRLRPEEKAHAFKRKGADIDVLKSDPGSDLSRFEQLLLTRIAASGKHVTEEDLRQNVSPYLVQLRAELFGELVSRGYYLMSPRLARVAWTVAGLLVVAAMSIAAVTLSPNHTLGVTFIGAVIGAAIVIFFSHLMPQRTPKGAAAYRKLRGFEIFLRRARTKEFEWLTNQHPDEALFEKYLPYAIAFGISSEWAHAFECNFQITPQWYAGPPGVPYHPVVFARDLATVSDSMTENAIGESRRRP